jgi:hypothetical protein
VSPDDVDDFARESLCDNRMATMSVEAGQKLSLQTVIQLSAQAEAIYILASLESRGLDLVEQHRALWQSTSEFFDAALAIWESVPTDGELLCAHRRELKRLAEITKDRLQFYSEVGDDRRDYRQRKLD